MSYIEFWQKLHKKANKDNFEIKLEEPKNSPLLLVEKNIDVIRFGFAIEYYFPEVVIIMDGENKESEEYYRDLSAQKNDIEDEFGDELIWHKKTAKQKNFLISYKNLKLNFKKEEQSEEVINFLLENFKKIYKIIKVRIDIIYDKIKCQKELKEALGPPKLKKMAVKNFLSFNNSTLELSPGINLFIGENDSCKTGLMKLIYSVSKSWEIYSLKENYEKIAYKKILANKLFDVFQPRENIRIGDIVSKNGDGKLDVSMIFEKQQKHKTKISFCFGNTTHKTINDCPDEPDVATTEFNCLFIPAKEVLTAFRTIKYVREKLFLPGFDDTYIDLIKSLEAPFSYKKLEPVFSSIVNRLDAQLMGKIQTTVGQEPFIYVKQNKKYAISVTSEGVKKMGILSTLINNKQIRKGSMLFIDEPESNLSLSVLRNFIMELVRMANSGVQIFIASHSIAVLAQLTLSAKEKGVPIYCHTLNKNEQGNIDILSENLAEGIKRNKMIENTEKLLSDFKQYIINE